MAIYTPPSLPHTPHTLPPLPAELIASCSMWPYTKHELLTPPLTSTFEQRKTSNGNAPVHLPPIASFDRRPPLTPPDDISFKYASPYLPPIVPIYPSSHEDVPMLDYSAHDAPPQDLDIDWLNHDRTLNARLIAEKACEMVCWLWFGSDTSPRPEDAYPSPIDAPFTRPTSAQVLQLNPSPIFVQFMQKLLETTQVSHSVIVLSLYYIRRLRTKARASVQEGSEFRIAVAGLMMANKFLDDNTYTNKTWADVSGIGMEEINRMEREFLDGVDYNLYVDQPAFESWVQLLRGLVAAKQTAVRQYRKGRGRSGRPAPASAPRDHSSRRERWHRTRSTSPRSSEVAMSRSSEVAMSRSCAGPAWTPPSLPIIHAPSPIICTPSPGSKRTASAAFSPTTATFSDVPAKRASFSDVPAKRASFSDVPMKRASVSDVPAQRASISVQIPEYPQTYNAGAAPASYNAGAAYSPMDTAYSPMDTLSSFSKPELDMPSKPELDLPSRLELDMPSRLELNASSKLELNASSRLELNASSKLELQTPSKLELQTPSKPELDSPLDPSSCFARLSVHSRPSTPPLSSRLPPMQSSGLPPMQGSGLPPMQASGLPPMQSSGLPPMQGSGLPPMQSSGLPPMQSGGLPPMQRSGLPPMQRSGLPRMHPPQRQSSAQHQSTLSSAYTLDEARRAVVPQQMYFYALASSPTRNEEERTREARLEERTREARLEEHTGNARLEEGTRLEECTREEHTWRKARLRCQHPPPASTFAQHYVQTLPSLPMMVQSARTSPYEAVSALPRDAVSSLPRDAVSSLPRDALSSMPRDAVSSLPRDAATSLPRDAVSSLPHRPQLPTAPSLPHFNETDWTRPPVAYSSSPVAPAYSASAVPRHSASAAPAYPSPHAEALKVYTPSLEVDMPSLKVDMPSLKVYSPSPQRHAPVQFAPFANAGPPGVHQFYPSPAGQRYPQAPVSPNAYYASPNAYDASSNAYDASSNAYGASSNAYGASSNAYGASPNAYYPPRRRVY